MESLVPDFLIKNVADLTPEDFRRHGIKAAGFDVDGTLTDYRGELKSPQRDMLQALADSGIMLTIISNTDSERARELEKMFDSIIPKSRIVTPGENLRPKPSPDMIRKALATTAGITPPEFLMVGDQILKDIRAGNQAGVQTLLTSRLGNGDHPGVRYAQRPAEMVIRTLTDLPLARKAYPETLTKTTDWQRELGDSPHLI